ncbi:MAG: 3'(2'),5'-bisphosphate nucleotidase CysQ [Acidobacteriota bacterium]
MFEQELETAVRLARLAGKTILEHYAEEIIAEEKFGVDNLSEPVTAADRAASRIIVDGLLDAFPHDGILSEEEIDLPDGRLSKRRVWIIDPIDGTWGFVKRDGDFAVQIGLAVDGEPVLGVVFVPLTDKLYFASQGDGSYLSTNGGAAESLQVSDITDFSEMSVAVSRNHPNPRMKQLNEHFGFASQVQRGGIGVKVGLIVERECDVYINLSPRSKFWDTCGPQAIMEEAGGKLTDIFGEPIRYDIGDVQNYNGIIACSEAAHSLITEKLRPLLNDIGRQKLKAKAV